MSGEDDVTAEKKHIASVSGRALPRQRAVSPARLIGGWARRAGRHDEIPISFHIDVGL